MLLIGAGALAEYVATMALFNDFAVTVCDPRIEHRGTWTVAGVALSTEMPDDAVRTLNPDPRTCIVALSHDPKLDDLALLAALHSPAFYVGAIGSPRHTPRPRGRLAPHFPAAQHREPQAPLHRALRRDGGLPAASACAGRPLHRQQDPRRNRGERDGGNPGGEEWGETWLEA